MFSIYMSILNSKQYKEYLKMNLSIDMTRGKPSKKQLELSMPMLDVLNSKCDLDSILSKKIACIVLNTSDI